MIAEGRTCFEESLATRFPEIAKQISDVPVEENNELMRTPVVERAIELVLTGLSRIRYEK